MLSLQLQLEGREADRVFVSVGIEPDADDACVDGVAVELFSSRGESLGPRLLLPISGRLHGPLLTTVELRAPTTIPAGASVVGTAWRGELAYEARLPADPASALGTHVLGSRKVCAKQADRVLRSLDDAERRRLREIFPWVPCVRRKRAHDAREPLDPVDYVESVASDLGLDDDCAKWLKDLLEEDDDGYGLDSDEE